MDRFVENCHYALGVLSLLILVITGFDNDNIALVAAGLVSCILFFGIGTVINSMYRIWRIYEPEEERGKAVPVLLCCLISLTVVSVIIALFFGFWV